MRLCSFSITSQTINDSMIAAEFTSLMLIPQARGRNVRPGKAGQAKQGKAAHGKGGMVERGRDELTSAEGEVAGDLVGKRE